MPTVEKPTIKTEWYQSEEFLYLSIFIKKLKKEDVEVNYGEKTLSVTAKLPAGSDYSYELDLSHEILPSDCVTSVLGTKMELKMKKAMVGLKWNALEGDDSLTQMMGSAADKPPQYPSSAKRSKDWNNLEKEVKQEESEEKPEGDAALNKLFQQIYSDATPETRRAMNKSFQESGGTCLSTNWDEVGAKKTEISPPEGMVAKKY
eukprot:Lithocolla_globosa_v1_NODE_8232_length_846_cov_174.510746.p1 type:complete len:204 gc:universal NODE_8232_length_846_cov_174.510746:84-695(+)